MPSPLSASCLSAFMRPNPPAYVSLCLGVVMSALAISPLRALEKCESLAEVRSQIDAIVKTGSPHAQKFRKEVQDGADSFHVIEELSPPDMARKLDVCRYEAVEYLVKLGFPPAH